MGRIGLAFRLFFAVLFHREVAERLSQALAGPTTPAQPAAPPPQPPAPLAPKPARSEALTLLATLQREARLVDFLQESLTEYSDAQIGAVVRDIHRDSQAVVARLFALRPVAEGGEGTSIELPVGFDAARYRLVGNVSGTPPHRGVLVHPGWEATMCDLPAWTGGSGAARVVAPAEVELK